MKETFIKGAVEKLTSFLLGVMTMSRKDEYQSKFEFIHLNVFVPENHIIHQINENHLYIAK